MCGIVGYVGNKNVIKELIKGLESLEYRGYDSSGIAVYDNDEIKVFKAIGKLNNLKNSKAVSSISSDINTTFPKYIFS